MACQHREHNTNRKGSLCLEAKRINSTIKSQRTLLISPSLSRAITWSERTLHFANKGHMLSSFITTRNIAICEQKSEPFNLDARGMDHPLSHWMQTGGENIGTFI